MIGHGGSAVSESPTDQEHHDDLQGRAAPWAGKACVQAQPVRIERGPKSGLSQRGGRTQQALPGPAD